jgi:hypothetical protein
VEHRSKGSVEAAIAVARDRYLRGATAFRLMRVTNPEGQLTIIDFEQDRARQDPTVAELVAAAEERAITRAAAEQADQRWRLEIHKAYQRRMTDGEIARAAGTSVAHVRAVLRTLLR